MFGSPWLRKAPVAFLLIMTIAMVGCESDSPTTPENGATDAAPLLPNATRLNFDLSFFAPGEALEKSGDKSHDNFVNAYLRAVVLEAMAHLVLTPPVTAFSLALNTPPSPQDDGSWIWVYTFVDGDEEVQIRLRGLPVGDRVEWELWVSASDTDPPLDEALWFYGATREDGDEGQWTFLDLEEPGHPVCGEIAWGSDAMGDYLTFTSRELDSDGDTLRFTDANPNFSIVYTDDSSSEQWFIRWHADGSGSLRVPDYNGGAEACWDDRQRDVDCD